MQLQSEHTAGTLAGATVRAGKHTAVAQILRTVVSTLGLMVLARVLTPSDFGLIAKVAAVTGVTNILADMGLSAATVQKHKITTNQLNLLFWANVGASIVVALVILALGPLLTFYYEDSRVIYVTTAFSICTLVRGLSLQHLAILRRNMRFDLVARIEIASVFISTLIAVVSSFRIGYAALLLQPIVAAVIGVVGSWYILRWIPGRPHRDSQSRSILSMGGNLTAAKFLNYFSRNADNLLIGRVWGEASLGLYAKAYGLLLLPLQQISGPMASVAVPALSKLQYDPTRYRQFFVKGCTLAMLLQIPITIFAAIAGQEIVLTMLGEQWAQAVPIFHALIPALFASATSPASGWVFLSLGRTDRYLKIVTINSVIVVIGFLVSVPFGPVLMAWTFSLIVCAMRVPTIVYCFRGSPLRLSDFFATLHVPVGASLIAGCISEVISRPFFTAHVALMLFGKALIFFSAYAALISLTSAGKHATNQVKLALRGNFPAKPNKKLVADGCE